MTSRSKAAEPADPPLVCPACAAGHGLDERFCRACGTPLVLAGGTDGARPLSAAGERARKVRPQYAEGALVRVAAARHQAEAELLQGMLLEEGVPSLVRRSGGFDVPDFLASGPRDILVPASGAAAARDILRVPDPQHAPTPGASGTPPWVRALAASLAVLVLALVAAGVYAAVFG